jgi:hypothetical protein
MGEEAKSHEAQFEAEQLTKREVAGQVFAGIGIAAGLALLWAMETVRNAYFRLLDRLNVKPRRRRASAFPPGKPRRRRTQPAA